MIARVFYRLSELAEQWQCTVHDLLHLAIQDRAQVCVNIYGMATGSKRTPMSTEDDEPSPDDVPLTEEERREAEAHDAAIERWKARTTQDMPHGVFELGHVELRFLDMPDAFPYELHEALKFDGGWWECEFDPPVSINLDHLCMLHEEVMRLQLEMFSSFYALSVAIESDSGFDGGFYPKAVFPKAGLARTAISQIDAAMWLLGVATVQDIGRRSIKERDAFGSNVYKALEEVEIAIAMGELKATTVMTTRARREQEYLQEVVDPIAKAGGLQVMFNQGTHVYLAPRELKVWWTGRNAALKLDNHERTTAAQTDPRSETSFLNIIGALLELVRSPRQGRDSDAAVIRELIENYSDKPGISKTTLETKFAAARRRLNSN